MSRRGWSASDLAKAGAAFDRAGLPVREASIQDDGKSIWIAVQWDADGRPGRRDGVGQAISIRAAGAGSIESLALAAVEKMKFWKNGL